jgi:hypothetical protein
MDRRVYGHPRTRVHRIGYCKSPFRIHLILIFTLVAVQTHVPGLHCMGSSTLPMCVQFRLATMRSIFINCIGVWLFHAAARILFLLRLLLHAAELASAPHMLSVLTVIFESSSAFLTILRCVKAIRAGGGVKILRHGVMFILFKQGGGISFVRCNPGC